MNLLPQGFIKLFAVCVGVGGDDSDIAMLRNGIVDGCILLDYYLQRLVVTVCGGTGVFSDVLTEYSMFSDTEWRRHCFRKHCGNAKTRSW